MSGSDLQLEFLDHKLTTDERVGEIIQLVSKAFTDYNKSVGSHPEVIKEEFGDEKIAFYAITGLCRSYDGYATLDGDGKVVGVTLVDVHAKGSRVATLGPVASAVPGAGRKTFEAACAHAEKLGFTTLVLLQIASNTRSFSLYAKLGFETKHVCHHFGGFLPSSEDSPPALADTDDLTVTVMTAVDVKECADLFLAAHGTDCGWDRQPDIQACLESNAPYSRLVARAADGKVVGYSTGFYGGGHQIAASQDVFCAMFQESSRLHQQMGLACPSFQCPMEYPGLVKWALKQRLTTYRAVLIMAKGHYEHAWPGSGYIAAPSGLGW